MMEGSVHSDGMKKEKTLKQDRQECWRRYRNRKNLDKNAAKRKDDT